MNSTQALKAIVKREFNSYFHSAIAYVFLVVFLVFLTFLTFRFGGWFSLNKADLIPFFSFHPYLYLFFIPALAMRAWAEEEREGTVELLLTFPISAWQAVLGKFLASWFFLATALFLTFPMVITVFSLGDPDPGMIISGYIASFLLGGVFLSLSTLASVLTPNQVISYIVSFIVLLFLSGVGLRKISEIFPDWLSADLLETLELFSTAPHFDAFQRGVLDARDVLYNLSIILFGLLSTTAVLRCRKAAHKHNKSITFAGLAVLSVILLLVNVLAKKTTFRIDLTQDRLYTLSESTEKVLAKLEAPATIRFYFSKSHIDTDLEKKALALRVEDLIKEFVYSSNGQLTYEVIDPVNGSDEEGRAILDGMTPFNFDKDRPAYLGLSIQYLDKNLNVPELSKIVEADLEFQVTRLFNEAVQKEKPVLAIMTPLAVYGQDADVAKQRYKEIPPWRFIQEMSKDYTVYQIPHELQFIDPKVQVLVLLHPENLPLATLYALDQYILQGGRVIAFLDPYYVLNSQIIQQGEQPVAYQSSLTGLSESWGVRIDLRSLLYDEANEIAIQNERRPFMLNFNKDNLDQSQPFLKTLKRLKMSYPGVIQYQATKGLTVTPIIKISKTAQLIELKTGLQPKELRKTYKADGKEHAIAVRIQGDVETAFKNDVPKGFEDRHLKKSTKPMDVVLVADADMMHNSFSFTKEQDFKKGEQVVRSSNNVDFLMNLIEEMSSDGDLIALRSRVKQNRALTGFEDKKVELEAIYGAQRSDLYTELNKAQKEREELKSKQIKQFLLNRDEKARLETLATQISDLELEIRKVNRELDKQVESYQTSVALRNVFIIPFIIILFGIFSSLRQKRKVARR